MDKICLYGASGHGKVIKEIIESQNNVIIAFFDDSPKNIEIFKIPILTNIKLEKFKLEKFIISIGNNEIRKKIAQLYNFKYATAIHINSKISNSSIIDNGTVIMPGAVINADSKIGEHCIINSNAVVEHDCKIESYVHISPSATLCGNVDIGEGTHVGAGAIIIPNIKIGKWVTIGAGAVVIFEIPDFAVVVGNPGKIIKYNKR